MSMPAQSGWTSPDGGRYRRTHRFGIYACLECGALVPDADPDDFVPIHDAFHASLRTTQADAEWDGKIGGDSSL